MSSTFTPAYPLDVGYAPRKTLAAWYLYDVAISVIDTLMITFVFSLYLTSASFGDTEKTTNTFSFAMGISAAVVALAAPLVGRFSDRTNRRSLGLTICTGLCSVATAACFFVSPHERFLMLGVVLLCTANAAKELALVDYYAALPTLVPQENVGRASGTGWAAGYIGAILASAFVLFGFVSPGFLGLPTEEALNIRAVALFCGLWCLALSIPLLLSLRQREKYSFTINKVRTVTHKTEKIWQSYREIFLMVRHLWGADRSALFFLVSSAIFRDGVSGIFTFGGILAMGTFGFTLQQSMMFAIIGNLSAGIGALFAGRLDDYVSSKRVIVASLSWIIAAALPLLFLTDQAAFWVCGLLVCLAVGPAQASSRSYLARIVAQGAEGSLYGLYATTGRGLSFLAPMSFWLSVSLLGAQRWGIVGILTLIALGLALLLPLPNPQRGSDSGAVKIKV